MKNPQSLSSNYRAALSFIKATPLSRGIFRRYILKFIKKRVDYPIITDFRGVPFVLNLDNTTEAKALFGHYNLEELAFMKEGVSTCVNPVFVDLGGNSGFYTQNFLALGKGLALAVEPNPAMCDRIKNNYALLQKEQPERHCRLILECCAVGASGGTAELDLSQGLGAANIVEQKKGNTISVKMETLLDMLKRHEIDKIDVMKVDIEGYEDRALIPFFEQAEPRLCPLHIIIEHTSREHWERDLISVLEDKGYTSVRKTRGNLLMSKANERGCALGV